MPQFCPFCGARREDAWGFCPVCGKSIPSLSGSSEADGAPSQSETSYPTNRISSRPATSSRKFWVKQPTLIIVILLVAGIAYYLGTTHFNFRSPATNLSPASEDANSGAAVQTASKQVLSPEQIYRFAAPAVVLITNFDAHTHKRAMGSGFLVSSQGDIATNYHVIRGAYQAEVKFSDGTESPVIGVVGYSPEHDVAVIRVGQLSTIQPLSLGSPDSLKIGQSLLAIGSPLGLQNTFSQGILSARRGGILQMTTPISPGSSGGPVLNQFGKVVGISDAYAPAGENINFAIPISWAAPYIGRAPQQKLEEVAKENAAVTPISLSVSVPARQAKTFPLRIAESMADPELDLSFVAHGGLNNVADLWVIEGNKTIWDSGLTASGQAQIDLPGPGSYQIVVDNRASTVFPRTVIVNGQLEYVK